MVADTHRFVAVRQAARRGVEMVRGSLVRAVRGEHAARHAGRPSPAPERAQPDPWDEPVPLVEDRDGNLHPLL